MTTSRPSGSEPASGSFDLLHPGVQRWIWQRQWRALHDAQESAIPVILAREEDVLISAATASGKTEAAFLPICSALADGQAATGFGAVYIGPLKALINDQFGRLEELCGQLQIPVHRWHGDVDASRKARLVRQPSGILLITPESLEALFVNRGTRIASLFRGVRHIVIDELHSFIGSERGAQLQSLLHRLELAVRHPIPRIGLSATLGDMGTAAEFLRPGGGGNVRLISSSSDAQELRLQIKGYLDDEPRRSREQAPEGERAEDVIGGGRLAIADHLFTALRGSNNLVFANARQNVELFTDLLVRRSERAGVPNEFVPHHGSLSKEIREDTEARLKESSLPVTAICTSTLEMGIDIGSIVSVAQIGAPPGVAALRQRLGRAGRRGGPATLRMYVAEPEITSQSAPQEELRTQLVQIIAIVNLLLDRWYEPPETGGLHLSTLVQQILSMISQHGGVTPHDAYQTLCAHGPFRHVDPRLFKTLLRDLGEADLLRQERDGLLLHGQEGERIVNHYTFFAAFASPEEYRLVTGGRTLGSLPITYPLVEGDLMIFAGRRWKIIAVDQRSKVIELAAAGGGNAPPFWGAPADVHDRVRAEMRLVYETEKTPVYLDAGAQRLLTEGRNAYRRLSLAETPIVGWGNDTLLIPLRGDTIMSTLALALHQRGISVGHQGAVLTLSDTSPQHAIDVLADLADGPAPEAEELAVLVPDKTIEKYDDVLSEELRTTAYAARKLDVATTWAALPDLVAVAQRAAPAHRSVPAPAARIRHEIGSIPYAVIDVETTGLDPLRDRIVEIAVLRLGADGAVERSYKTVLHNDSGPGPTHIHGLTAGDLAGAPAFSDVAGDLAELIDGTVLVAHNAQFDSAMLTNEFARTGAAPDDLLTLCTLDLARRFGPGQRSLALADCAAEEGIPPGRAHTASDDAQVTVQLLLRYLDRARQAGHRWLDEIGAVGGLPTKRWAPWAPSRRHRGRTHVPAEPLRRRLPIPVLGSRQETVYADHVARAALTPDTFARQIPLLRDTASKLELSSGDLARIHRHLAEAWRGLPGEQSLLHGLD
ncbi:DEAD/DEAH box helicase [Actinomadura craniellae]|uniref:DEAD/DEAH box helicase n=1 Tax=Actinomadura craniellae TaxID=2231787 RepID=UPI00131425A3|nr:DEAD/DEAH box helicase [Actinomadura craniellae]